jgi:hypothetical protein
MTNYSKHVAMVIHKTVTALTELQILLPSKSVHTVGC